MRAFLACLVLAVCCAVCFAQPAQAKKSATPGGGASKNEPHKNRGNAGGHGKGNPGKADRDDRGGGRDKADRDGRGYDKDDVGDRAAGHLLRAGITALEARRFALDERLTGLHSLPPGIRKNLARGKPLPPGIAKKMLPPGLLGRLPVHPGYEWRMLGTDLVLVYLAQDLVADILLDVFK